MKDLVDVIEEIGLATQKAAQSAELLNHAAQNV